MMKVHNRMEEIVFELIDDFYDDMRSRNHDFCACARCRLDLACYILNKTDPSYIISERGLFHAQSDYQNNIQKMADLSALVRDGFNQIQKVKRHPNQTPDTNSRNHETGPHYNFPVIQGKLLFGSTFENITKAKITLFRDSEICPTMSSSWTNPYIMTEATAGQYFFLPRPSKAKEAGEKKSFEFLIKAESENMDPVELNFKLTLISDDDFEEQVISSRVHKVSDLYFFSLT